MATATAAPPIMANSSPAYPEAEAPFVCRPGSGPVSVPLSSGPWVGFTTAVEVTVTRSPLASVEVNVEMLLLLVDSVVVVGSSEEVGSVVLDVSVEVGSVVEVEEEVGSDDVAEVGVFVEVGSEVLVGPEVGSSVDDVGSSVEVVVGGVSVDVGSGSVDVGSGSDEVGSVSVWELVSVSVSDSVVELGGSVVSVSVEVGPSVTVSLAPAETSCLLTKLRPFDKAKSRSLRSARAVRSFSTRLWTASLSMCSMNSRTSTRETVPRSSFGLSGAGAATVDDAMRETQRSWRSRFMTAMMFSVIGLPGK